MDCCESAQKDGNRISYRRPTEALLLFSHPLVSLYRQLLVGKLSLVDLGPVKIKSSALSAIDIVLRKFLDKLVAPLE